MTMQWKGIVDKHQLGIEPSLKSKGIIQAMSDNAEQSRRVVIHWLYGERTCSIAKGLSG